MTQAKHAACNALTQLTLHLAQAITADGATAPLPPVLAGFVTPGAPRMQKTGLNPVFARVFGLKRRPGARADAYAYLDEVVDAPRAHHGAPGAVGDQCGCFRCCMKKSDTPVPFVTREPLNDISNEILRELSMFTSKNGGSLFRSAAWAMVRDALVACGDAPGRWASKSPSKRLPALKAIISVVTVFISAPFLDNWANRAEIERLMPAGGRMPAAWVSLRAALAAAGAGGAGDDEDTLQRVLLELFQQLSAEAPGPGRADNVGVETAPPDGGWPVVSALVATQAVLSRRHMRFCEFECDEVRRVRNVAGGDDEDDDDDDDDGAQAVPAAVGPQPVETGPEAMLSQLRYGKASFMLKEYHKRNALLTAARLYVLFGVAGVGNACGAERLAQDPLLDIARDLVTQLDAGIFADDMVPITVYYLQQAWGARLAWARAGRARVAGPPTEQRRLRSRWDYAVARASAVTASLDAVVAALDQDAAAMATAVDGLVKAAHCLKGTRWAKTESGPVDFGFVSGGSRARFCLPLPADRPKYVKYTAASVAAWLGRDGLPPAVRADVRDIKRVPEQHRRTVLGLLFDLDRLERKLLSEQDREIRSAAITHIMCNGYELRVSFERTLDVATVAAKAELVQSTQREGAPSDAYAELEAELGWYEQRYMRTTRAGGTEAKAGRGPKFETRAYTIAAAAACPTPISSKELAVGEAIYADAVFDPGAARVVDGIAPVTLSGLQVFGAGGAGAAGAEAALANLSTILDSFVGETAARERFPTFHSPTTDYYAAVDRVAKKDKARLGAAVAEPYRRELFQRSLFSVKARYTTFDQARAARARQYDACGQTLAYWTDKVSMWDRVWLVRQKRKFVARLANDIVAFALQHRPAEHADRPIVIVFGSWWKGAGIRRRPAPVSALQRELASRPGVAVILQYEGNTSKYCHRHQVAMEPCLKFVRSRRGHFYNKGEKTTVHQRKCGHGCVWNSGTNGAIGQLRRFICDAGDIATPNYLLQN